MNADARTKEQLLSEIARLRQKMVESESLIVSLKRDKEMLQYHNHQLENMVESLRKVISVIDRDGLKKINEQLQQEINERKRAEKELHDAHQQLLDIIDFLPDATFVVDQDRRVIAWNRAIEEMTGVPKEKIIGKGDFAYAIPFYGKRIPILIDMIFMGEKSIKHQYKKIEKTGNRIYTEAYTPYVYNGKGAFLRASASPLFDREGNLIGGIESIRDITQRIKAMEELRLSEERFAKAFHGNPVAMAITTLNGRFIDVNKSLLSTTGYNRREIIGKTVVELNVWLNIDERKKFLKRVLKRGYLYNVEFNFRKKSGEIRTGLMSMELISVGNEKCLLSLFSDITEHMKILEALKRSENEKKVILESISELVIHLDTDMRVKWANTAVCNFAGLEPEQLVGAYCYKIFHKRNSPCPKCTLKKAVETGKFQQFEITTSGGRTWSQRFYPVKGDTGNVLGVVEVAQDITERKLEMAMYERLNLIGQMAAGIGHEIRNPMTTVRGFLQLLGSKQECADFESYFDLMIDELDRANHIITQFLSLARNNSVEKKMQNLNTIVRTIAPLIQADAFKTGSELELELKDIPDLFLDEKEIRQLILNMTRNGLEAMPSGGNLTIKTYPDGNEVVLAVQDQGSGLEPHVMKNLGTPFFTTKDDGTGLGLAVCYSIAARHKARIEVETGPRGTVFLVRFKHLAGSVD